MNWWHRAKEGIPLAIFPSLGAAHRVAGIQCEGALRSKGLEVVRNIEQAFNLLDHARGPFRCIEVSEEPVGGADAVFMNDNRDAGLRLLICSNRKAVSAGGLVYDACGHGQPVYVERPTGAANDLPYTVVKTTYSLLDRWGEGPDHGDGYDPTSGAPPNGPSMAIPAMASQD